ncbi:MAG: helix-turn-helix domain-containing protein [Dermatophilaceae bacterium]
MTGTATHREPDELDSIPVHELSRLLGLGRGTTYAHLADGTIPATRVGRRWIVSRSVIKAWLDTCRQDA